MKLLQTTTLQSRRDNIFLSMIQSCSNESIIESARQLLSTADCTSMINYKALDRDVSELETMMKHLQDYQAQLEDNTLELHKRQIIQAAVVSLKEIIDNKTRDVKRRLR